ncbi:hypothetical protein FBT69_04330 [Synechococcales cyanobacterium CNB]|nr:hypothetical protein [Phycisphaerales bacterium]MDL1904028.1 hypothetical protein [Synechococcales cyanobacterium CNB]
MACSRRFLRSTPSLCLLGLALAVAPLGGVASGQAPIVVSPGFKLTPAGQDWFECSIAVSQTNSNEALVMSCDTLPGAGFSYATILWGQSIALGRTALGSLDVYAAPHPTDGTAWFTGVHAGDPSGTVVGWKNAGALSIQSGDQALIATSGLQDKPGIAVGVKPSTPTTIRHYVVRQKGQDGGCNNFHQHKSALSENAHLGPGSWSWNEHVVEPAPGSGSPCHFRGWGAGPVVLSTGRIVVVMGDEKSGPNWLYNDGKPYAVYSDDGIDWRPDYPTEPFVLVAPGSVVAPTTVNNNCQNTCPQAGCGGTPCGDTPYLADRRKNAPSIAVDRWAGIDDVYVAFYAKKSSSGSSNTDIIVCRGIQDDQGALTFPVILPDHLLHLTDSLLGLSPGEYGPDQFVPAIAVDSCGGVNLMFYDNRHDPDLTDAEEWVDVYYARIMGFGTANPVVQQWRLTPRSFRVDNLPTGFLGDYHNLSVSADGNTLYAAYIARDMADPENGPRTCYLHRINVNPCEGFLLDFNGDGTVNEDDTAVFLAAFDAKAPEADLNLDWTVDAEDLTLFLDWYASESAK